MRSFNSFEAFPKTAVLSNSKYQIPVNATEKNCKA